MLTTRGGHLFANQVQFGILFDPVGVLDGADVFEQPAVVEIERGVDELALIDADLEEGHLVDAKQRLVEEAGDRGDRELLVRLVSVKAESHGALAEAGSSVVRLPATPALGPTTTNHRMRGSLEDLGSRDRPREAENLPHHPRSEPCPSL